MTSTSNPISPANRHAKADADASATDISPAKLPNKLEQLEALLTAKQGASIAELVTATGWQPHSVRGAMAGALKKRGLTIASDKTDGVRRYRATRA